MQLVANLLYLVHQFQLQVSICMTVNFMVEMPSVHYSISVIIRVTLLYVEVVKDQLKRNYTEPLKVELKLYGATVHILI